jgi:hypothetical protein
MAGCVVGKLSRAATTSLLGIEVMVEDEVLIWNYWRRRRYFK